jgi:hypothetical protein
MKRRAGLENALGSNKMFDLTTFRIVAYASGHTIRMIRFGFYRQERVSFGGGIALNELLEKQGFRLVALAPNSFDGRVFQIRSAPTQSRQGIMAAEADD